MESKPVEFNSEQFDDSTMHGDQAASGSTGEGQETDESTPFIVGSEGEDEGVVDALGGSESTSRFNSGTLLIVVVIILAGAGLFSMRTLGRVSAAVDTNNDLEATIEAFLQGKDNMNAGSDEASAIELVNRNKEVLEVLTESYTNRQVPASQLARNPFIIQSTRTIGDEPKTNPSDQADAAMERKRQQRKSRLRETASRLNVKSILMGSEPLANINDEVLTAGDLIDINFDSATFRVEQIKQNSVRVKATDHELEVTVSVDLMLQRR